MAAAGDGAGSPCSHSRVETSTIVRPAGVHISISSAPAPETLDATTRLNVGISAPSSTATRASHAMRLKAEEPRVMGRH